MIATEDRAQRRRRKGSRTGIRPARRGTVVAPRRCRRESGTIRICSDRPHPLRGLVEARHRLTGTPRQPQQLANAPGQPPRNGAKRSGGTVTTPRAALGTPHVGGQFLTHRRGRSTRFPVLGQGCGKVRYQRVVRTDHEADHARGHPLARDDAAPQGAGLRRAAAGVLDVAKRQALHRAGRRRRGTSALHAPCRSASDATGASGTNAARAVSRRGKIGGGGRGVRIGENGILDQAS